MSFPLNTLARAVALACLAAPCAHAQQPESQHQNSQQQSADKILPAVIVIGERYQPDAGEQQVDAARKAIGQTPGGVTIVDTETVREGRVSTFQDALGMAAGVFIQPRFGAEESRISIRGSGLQRTFHLRGLRLMQDGVPLNLADGSGDFQSIEMLAARHIEVFRGANALQYGSTTLGGAINFVSPTGHAAAPAEVRAEAGSFGYRRLFGQFAGVGGTDRKLDYVASIGYLGLDGFRDHAHQENVRFNGNLGVAINPDLESRFYLALDRSNSQLPGNLTKAELESTPRKSTNLSDASQKRDTSVKRLSNKTTLRLGDGVLEASAFYSEKTLFHPIFQLIDQTNHDYGVGLRYVLDSTLGGRRNRLTVGIAPARGTTDETQWINNAGRRGTLVVKNTQDASNIDLYAENQFYLDTQTSLIAGAQHSIARREITDLLGKNSLAHTYRGTSPKLGVLHETAGGAQVFANVSASFEPPPVSEMNTAAFLSAPFTPALLKAQTGVTAEIGTRGRSAALEWDAALYYAHMRNEFLSEELFPTRSTTVNVPRTVHAGLEAALTWRPADPLEWRNALLVNAFRFDGDPLYGNNALPGIPRALLRSSLQYQFSNGMYAGANLEWSPRRMPIDMANSYFADGYRIWGLKAGQRIKQGLSWFVEARNLFDKKYAATTGVVANAGGKDVAQFLPGDGRSVFVGLEWKL